MAGVKFWLDSANLEDIKWASTAGFVCGITMNHSLIAKEPKQDLDDLLRNVFHAISDGWGDAECPVSFPAIGADATVIMENADALQRNFGDMGLRIKIPVSRETLGCIQMLACDGAAVNATCIFTGMQAALAETAGAKILSVFVGRINDDLPGYGWKVIEAARKVCGDAEVLAGSLRDKDMVAAAIDHGAHIVTASRKVLETLAEERGTALSVAKFNADLEAWMA